MYGCVLLSSFYSSLSSLGAPPATQSFQLPFNGLRGVVVCRQNGFSAAIWRKYGRTQSCCEAWHSLIGSRRARKASARRKLACGPVRPAVCGGRNGFTPHLHSQHMASCGARQSPRIRGRLERRGDGLGRSWCRFVHQDLSFEGSCRGLFRRAKSPEFSCRLFLVGFSASADLPW